jgi:hypothetical protein
MNEDIAPIADPRNDSHLLISQMHLAMLKAHNAFVDEARLAGVKDDCVFDEAARQLRWHYQWFVLNEFLPALGGHALADRVLIEGPHWFQPGIPIEFTGGLQVRALSDSAPVSLEPTDRSGAALSRSFGILSSTM